MVNPALVPRSRNCPVCKRVAKVEDVTVRLFNEEGERLPPKEAIAYLRSIGMTGSPTTFYKRIDQHAKHIQRALASPPVVVDPHDLVPVEPVGGPPAWVDANAQAIEVGMDALTLLATRLTDMEDKDLIATAKLGQTAASKRGDWEAKGRQLSQMDAVLKLAAGLK